MRIPGAKEQLAMLSKTSEVLVADCRGRYALFQGQSDAPLSERIRAALDERVLR
jgi:hypothetical protein